MRDYSKPPFQLTEMSAVFIGVCNAINEPCEQDISKISSNPSLANLINSLSDKYGSSEKATGNSGQTGKALQSLVETLIENNAVTIEKLTDHIHTELHKLKPSLFVDYFTGEKKGNW